MNAHQRRKARRRGELPPLLFKGFKGWKPTPELIAAMNDYAPNPPTEIQPCDECGTTSLDPDKHSIWCNSFGPGWDDDDERDIDIAQRMKTPLCYWKPSILSTIRAMPGRSVIRICNAELGYTVLRPHNIHFTSRIDYAVLEAPHANAKFDLHVAMQQLLQLSQAEADLQLKDDE